MYSLWLFLKDNMNCAVKPTEVLPPGKIKGNDGAVHRSIQEREQLLRKNRVDDVICRQKYGSERFNELNIGDTSRNIVEMIFHAASMKPEKNTAKIERVLKVKNSQETLERFEEYREMVKKRAMCLEKWHLRSAVDGNELLRFHATSMTCCFRKTVTVSDLCRSPACGVCRIIRSGFGPQDAGSDGIRLSATAEITDDDMVGPKGKNVKRAVMVCRAIAGRAVNTVEGTSEEGFDSLGSEGFYSELDHLFVRNPNAILPCFVILIS
eukprot:TRINITY_DN17425_c0_g1_i1.p1 TRINITY_DN17425_c0_g1~~TRINITY_DN17425_c0_g1_i1.p1  ORF type:complete len:266 (+),score=29.63 TRINITY_DN17425_c0_g1_i1:222-1019(+)